MTDYSNDAIERAKDEALDWLKGAKDGYPRSWRQEATETLRRGYIHYETDFEAPPIAGYEALERDGIATRLETVVKNGQERIHFRIVE